MRIMFQKRTSIELILASDLSTEEKIKALQNMQVSKGYRASSREDWELYIKKQTPIQGGRDEM